MDADGDEEMADSTPVFGMTRCTRRQCVTCMSRLCMDNFVENKVTLQQFPISFNGTCRTSNCIYVIKCTHPNCNYQYVGHTINPINIRISHHICSILKGNGCRVLREHFTEAHSIDCMVIMPIALFPPAFSIKQRENIEEDWILKLNTVFPYGLNLRVKKAKVMDASKVVSGSNNSSIYGHFDVVKISRIQRGGSPSIPSSPISNFSVDTFFDQLLLLSFHDLRTKLCGLKKAQLKLVFIKSISLINARVDDQASLHKFLLIKDFSWFYLLRMRGNIPDRKSDFFIVIDFVNKHVEHIDFRKIFKNSDVHQASPFRSNNLSAPTISYKHPPTIRNKVLNYKDVCNQDTSSAAMTCDCASNAFKDPHHQHVITGDLSIVPNTKLRTLLSKGLNYRDQVPPSTDKAYIAAQNAVNNYCSKMSDRYKINPVRFIEWKTLILIQVKKQLESCKPYDFNSILSDPVVLADLKALHENYVLVPTDKAANNVTFVCKKFYLSMIDIELSSNNFEIVDSQVDPLIEKHRRFLLKHGITLHDDNHNLPSMYITPKQHKSPISSRFITSGNACSLQQLSIYLGICLKSMLFSAKNHSVYHNKFYPRNDYYVIDSNEPVLEFINMSNSSSGFKSVNTYDFSTLYTSIPHVQLKDNITSFVDRVFDFKDKPFLIPNLYTKKAYWSDNVSNNVYFSRESLIECIEFLIDNSYVLINNVIYRQVIGIPMGTNAGPQIANTYLHVYEHKYITHLILTNDTASLKKLMYIFRYQDDLISFNDGGLLGDLLPNIYPPEMIVNCTNVSARKCNYLDLCISIYRGSFRVVRYDKREDYSFKVISYPFLDGNVPKNLSYGVFISQLVRFTNINTTFNGFLKDVSGLIVKLVSQGYILAALRKKFNKFYHSKLHIWGKFGVDIFDEVIKLFG